MSRSRSVGPDPDARLLLGFFPAGIDAQQRVDGAETDQAGEHKYGGDNA